MCVRASDFTGQTQATEGRQLCFSTQLPDEKQHLPAYDTHTGPPQWRRFVFLNTHTHTWILDQKKCPQTLKFLLSSLSRGTSTKIEVRPCFHSFDLHASTLHCLACISVSDFALFVITSPSNNIYGGKNSSFRCIPNIFLQHNTLIPKAAGDRTGPDWTFPSVFQDSSKRKHRFFTKWPSTSVKTTASMPTD